MATDALGNPVRWHLTEVHDITQGPALIEGFNTEQVIADRVMTPTPLSPRFKRPARRR
jgi:hypothetical protein